MSQGGMQLTKAYRDRLDARFIAWYLPLFTNSRMCFWHWPVGGCDQDFPEYHKCVRFADGKATVDMETPINVDKFAATSDRNTNSWAVAIDGFADATTSDLGPNRCHPEQLRLAITDCAMDLDKERAPFGNCMTHAEAADCVDGYQDPQGPYGPRNGCIRWDFHVWIHPATLNMVPAFGGCPVGYLYFGDWLRGELALALQEITRPEWAGGKA